jgi:hypothetical protein
MEILAISENASVIRASVAVLPVYAARTGASSAAALCKSAHSLQVVAEKYLSVLGV